MNSNTNLPSLSNPKGFVMPVVILAMVILGALTVAALATARDEVRSSRALRESGTALYAAEAGANLLLGTLVAPPRTVLDTLAATMSPGDSVDFGWNALPNGASYRAVFYRYGNQSYVLDMTGRDTGPLPGEQSISYALGPAGNVINLTAAIAGGISPADEEVRMDDEGDGGVVVSGLDTLPAQWDAGTCPPLDDRAGVTWGDADNVRIDHTAEVYGAPPVEEDAGMDPFDWGDLDYWDLVAMATITLPDGSDLTNVNPIVSGSDCVDNDFNWGDPLDPSSPCASRFPIIHVPGDLRIRDGTGYGQGILLVDGELRIEDSFQFYGVILVRDRIRLEDDVQIFGGIVGGDRIEVEDGATVRNSTCAAHRAMNALNRQLRPIDTRAWSASLR